jgi:phage repressor protein C with HTH and peptisase S24 domain
VQLGTSDTLALPRIPPSSYIAIRPIDGKERQSPSPQQIYFLQHGSGYLCCGCAVRQGKLLILTQDNTYAGPHEFCYPGQIRIVGRVVSFGVRLPLVKLGACALRKRV